MATWWLHDGYMMTPLSYMMATRLCRLRSRIAASSLSTNRNRPNGPFSSWTETPWTELISRQDIFYVLDYLRLSWTPWEKSYEKSPIKKCPKLIALKVFSAAHRRHRAYRAKVRLVFTWLDVMEWVLFYIRTFFIVTFHVRTLQHHLLTNSCIDWAKSFLF